MTLRLIIEPTSKTIEVEGPGGVVPARLWEGRTEDGSVTGIVLAITRVAVPLEVDQDYFLAALDEVATPEAATEAWPHRLIL